MCLQRKLPGFDDTALTISSPMLSLMFSTQVNVTHDALMKAK